MLRDEDRLGWAAEPLHMSYVLRAESKPISPAQAIKVSEIANISIAIVRREAAFADRMHNLLSYARLLKKDYGAGFVCVRITNFVEDMMLSIFSAFNYRVPHICYI